jgi:hypothetical protein
MRKKAMRSQCPACSRDVDWYGPPKKNPCWHVGLVSTSGAARQRKDTNDTKDTKDSKDSKDKESGSGTLVILVLALASGSGRCWPTKSEVVRLWGA